MILRSNNNIVNSNNILNENIFKNNISFEWTYKFDKLYTIIIYGKYNKKIPKARSIDNYSIYYLASNISRNDISFKNEIIPYEIPLTSQDNNENEFFIKLYEHDAPFNLNDYSIIPKIKNLMEIDSIKLKIVNSNYDIYKKIEKIKISSEQLKNYLLKNENIDLAKKYFNKDVYTYKSQKENESANEKTKGTLKFCSCLLQEILDRDEKCLTEKKWNSESCSDPSYFCDVNVTHEKDKCICASLFDFDKLLDSDLKKLALYFNVDLIGKKYGNYYNREKAISILINEFSNQFNIKETDLHDAEDSSYTKYDVVKTPQKKINTKKPNSILNNNFKLNNYLDVDINELNDDDFEFMKKSPTRSVPKSPTRSVPKSPTRSVPKSPTRSTSKARSVPKSPTRSVPKSPSRPTSKASSVQKSPSRSTSKASSVPKSPARSTSKASSASKARSVPKSPKKSRAKS